MAWSFCPPIVSSIACPASNRRPLSEPPKSSSLFRPAVGGFEAPLRLSGSSKARLCCGYPRRRLSATRQARSDRRPLADLPERQRQLDLCQLHSILLDRLLGLDAEKVREQINIRYLRDAGEAVEQVCRGEANVAFLTNPVTMEQLREVAFAGEVMPQKATDFYPKLLSGLTIYALD